MKIRKFIIAAMALSAIISCSPTKRAERKIQKAERLSPQTLRFNNDSSTVKSVTVKDKVDTLKINGDSVSDTISYFNSSVWGKNYSIDTVIGGYHPYLINTLKKHGRASISIVQTPKGIIVTSICEGALKEQHYKDSTYFTTVRVDKSGINNVPPKIERESYWWDTYIFRPIAILFLIALFIFLLVRRIK